MKMILVILPNEKTDQVSGNLLERGYRVTKFASTAGFLSGGTTTLMVGASDEDVEPALEILRGNFSPFDGENVQATIYVLNVKDFKRIE